MNEVEVEGCVVCFDLVLVVFSCACRVHRLCAFNLARLHTSTTTNKPQTKQRQFCPSSIVLAVLAAIVVDVPDNVRPLSSLWHGPSCARLLRNFLFLPVRNTLDLRPPPSSSALSPAAAGIMAQQTATIQPSSMQLSPTQPEMPPSSYYPEPPNDLTGGLPINLDSLRDGPPGSKPFYPYSTLIR